MRIDDEENKNKNIRNSRASENREAVRPNSVRRSAPIQRHKKSEASEEPFEDDGLFDDISIDADIAGDKGMEDKILNRAMGTGEEGALNRNSAGTGARPAPPIRKENSAPNAAQGRTIAGNTPQKKAPSSVNGRAAGVRRPSANTAPSKNAEPSDNLGRTQEPARQGMNKRPFEAGGSLPKGAEKRRPKELNTAKTIIDREEYSHEKDVKKKSLKKKIIIFAVLEVFTLCLIFGYAYFMRTWNLLKGPDFNKEAVANNNIDITKKEEMEGYWTFAVFGVDSRGKGVGKGYNSDVIMIVSINKDSGDIKICSVFRDTYLNISDGNRYAKINEAYAAGGPEQAVKALNKNLDLDIDDYVTFNWKAVADGINILGGVDNIDISKAELYYINAYITETVKATNIGSVQLKHTGPQHLDGVQAVAYMRLRYMDNDFARTERQREVLQACFEKAKNADFSVLNNIIVVLADQVATNISATEMVGLAQGILKYNIADTGGFPWARGDANIPGKGACVIPTTLESNVKMLHEFLYGDDDYDVSKAVLGYSEKIKQDSNLYKEGKPIESVGTDGGYIPKPKTTAAEREDDDETETTKDKDKETEYETDEDGNLILPTDEDGHVVYPTDEDGNVLLPTDEDGNAVLPSTEETRPTDLADDNDIETGNDYGSEIVGPDGRPIQTRPDSGSTGPDSGSTGPDSTRPSSTRPDSTRPSQTGPDGTKAPTAGNNTRPTASSGSDGSKGPGDTSPSAPSQTQRPTEIVNPTMDSTVNGTPGGSAGPGSAANPGNTPGSPVPGGPGGSSGVQPIAPAA